LCNAIEDVNRDSVNQLSLVPARHGAWYSIAPIPGPGQLYCRHAAHFAAGLPQSSNSRPIGLSHTTLPSAFGAAAPSQTGGDASTTTLDVSIGRTISAPEVAATVGDLSVARLPQLRDLHRPRGKPAMSCRLIQIKEAAGFRT